MDDMQPHRHVPLTFLLAITLALVACGGNGDGGQPGASTTSPATVDQQSVATEPPDADPAPDFASIDAWHNSEPLTLASLRGSTVLIVFFSDT